MPGAIYAFFNTMFSFLARNDSVYACIVLVTSDKCDIGLKISPTVASEDALLHEANKKEENMNIARKYTGYFILLVLPRNLME